MQIVICHHHLHPGGVTQVVFSQLKALSTEVESGQVKLLLGSAPESGMPGLEKSAIMVHPELDYLDPENFPESKEECRSRVHVLKGIIEKSCPGDSVLHIHNLNLAKNPLLNLAVTGWLGEGGRVVNHCHDFAEDGRPENFNNLRRVCTLAGVSVAEILYPSRGSMMWAPINGRDELFLAKAGIPEKNICLLLNPVDRQRHKSDPKTLEAMREKILPNALGRIVLYPVRGIRRKNLGEFLLLSILFPEVTFITTQPPKNPAEQKAYTRWKKLSASLGGNTLFEAGRLFSFEGLCEIADVWLTTSVAEGFGMVFLESWLYEKKCVGRDLPPITRSFVKNGVVFSGLYQGINVPLKLVANRPGWESQCRHYWERAHEVMGLSFSDEKFDQWMDHLITDGNIDFANLDPENQASIMLILKAEPETTEKILELNPELCSMFGQSQAENKNQEVIRTRFSLEGYRAILLTMYQAMDSMVTPLPQTPEQMQKSMLQNFLSPENLKVVRA